MDPDIKAVDEEEENTDAKYAKMLNGISCDKLSTAVTAVRAHPDKYEKDFDAIVTFLSQYINKRALTQMWRLPLSVRADPPSSRGPVLPMALLRERLS